MFGLHKLYILPHQQEAAGTGEYASKSDRFLCLNHVVVDTLPPKIVVRMYPIFWQKKILIDSFQFRIYDTELCI